ncbi:MAG: hypothetical protein ABJF50_21050 [Paracoccaceae bacterium]
MSLLKNKAVHGAGGFLLMGGWAVFANRAFEMPAPVIAGVVQGVLTATITLFLKQVIETLFNLTEGWARLVLPPLTAFVFSAILLTTIHTMVGTPALIATIAVPLTVSTLYALLYNITLSRHV